jgi:uncharacterized protein YndB with AHSA1/START domain
MGHEFTEHDTAEIPATPEEVWAAIATGPGIDSWFMGRNEVKPGPDGMVRTAFGEYASESPITEWDPGRRFGYRSGHDPDGRFIAFEYLIEGRAGGSTVLRAVTSGFIPGDDWADEFEAMKLGGALYFASLVEYLTHFAGRFAAPITVYGPLAPDWPRDRARLYQALGLTEPVDRGNLVRFTSEAGTSEAGTSEAGTSEAGTSEAGPAEGVVYFVNQYTIGIRTADALYRFMRGFGGPVIATHELFAADADPVQAQAYWDAWLSRTFA